MEYSNMKYLFIVYRLWKMEFLLYMEYLFVNKIVNFTLNSLNARIDLTKFSSTIVVKYLQNYVKYGELYQLLSLRTKNTNVLRFKNFNFNNSIVDSITIVMSAM